MDFVFVSNFLNPHQYPLACELYKQTSGKYRFIETSRMPTVMKDSGYPNYSNLPWLIRAWESKDSYEQAISIAKEAKVTMFGGVRIPEILKFRKSENKLTFNYAERSLKRGWINLISPRILKNIIDYWKYCHTSPVYFLGASAFASYDNYRMGLFHNRCFRWGYFPTTSGAEIEEDNFSSFKNANKFRMMSVCRMLPLKRPLMMVRAAKALKNAGIPFEFDMYGTGELLPKVKEEISNLDLENEVSVHGSTPNEKVLREMQSHHCLLFTSTQREGWGAVVNEAMGCGCVVIGSSKIGSVPFLIENDVTGMIFRDGDQSDLDKKVIELASNINKTENIARAARELMKTIWSPAEAASRILNLSDLLIKGKQSPYESGPCSPAPIIKNNWI